MKFNLKSFLVFCSIKGKGFKENFFMLKFRSMPKRTHIWSSYFYKEFGSKLSLFPPPKLNFVLVLMSMVIQSGFWLDASMNVSLFRKFSFLVIPGLMICNILFAINLVRGWILQFGFDSAHTHSYTPRFWELTFGWFYFVAIRQRRSVILW